MPIHDLGYRSWGVAPGSSSLRWLVIAKTGISNAWKSRWLRRMVFFAWLPAALVGIGIFFFEQAVEQPGYQQVFARFLAQYPSSEGIADQVSQDPALARHAVWSWLIFVFFRYPQAVIMVMIVGLIAPRLIAQDVRSRAFLLYFSRPIIPIEYLLGKAAIIWTYLAFITTVPALTLYLLGVALSPGFSVVIDTYDVPLRIILASLVLSIPTSSLALCFSSLTSESRYAGFMWFAIWILGWMLYSVMFTVTVVLVGNSDVTTALDSFWTLASLYHTLADVQQWIFGLQDFSKAFPSIISLTVLTLLSWSILMRRVTAPLRQ